MAPKRARDEALAGLPPRTKALKTLVEEGILNGYAAKSKYRPDTGPYAPVYKNQGIPATAAIQSAKHILHSSPEERGRYWDMLITGRTSICNVVKLIRSYKAEHSRLRVFNTSDASRGDTVLVIDSNGVIH